MATILDDFSSNLLATKYVDQTTTATVSGGKLRLTNGVSSNVIPYSLYRNDLTVGAVAQARVLLRAADLTKVRPGIAFVFPASAATIFAFVDAATSKLLIYETGEDEEFGTFLTSKGTLNLPSQPASNTDHTLLVKKNGTSLTATWNGVALSGSVTVSNYSGGYVGVGRWGTTSTVSTLETQYDDLWGSDNLTDSPPVPVPAITGTGAAVAGSGVVAPAGGRGAHQGAGAGISGSTGMPQATGTKAVAKAGQGAPLTATTSIDTPTGLKRLSQNQIRNLQWAAFGGADPYVAAKGGSQAIKGVICRPGSEFIGGRQDLTRGDRVLFFQSNAGLIKNGVGTVQKAELVLSALHIATWDHSVLVREAIAKMRVQSIALDLNSCTPEAALAAPLTGDLWTLNAVPQWLAGQTGYNSVDRAIPMGEYRIDITSAYNAAITGNTDLRLCLEFLAGASDKTVTELFGSLRADLAPRIDVVVTRAGVGFNVTDVDTGQPTVAITGNLAGGTKFRWGYTPDCGQGGFTPAGAGTFAWRELNQPTLETSRRVYFSLEWTEGDGLHRIEHHDYVPKALRAVATPPAVANYPTWQEIRGPVRIDPWTGTERWLVLAKVGGVWEVWNWFERTSDRFTKWINSTSYDGLPPLNAFADTVVGEPWYDWAANAVYFLSAKQNGAVWEVRVNELLSNLIGSANILDWRVNDGNQTISFRQSSVIYTATAQPDLKLSAVSRPYSWRNQEDCEPYQPLVCAFVADGALRVFSNTAKQISPVNACRTVPTLTAWTSEFTRATEVPDAEVAFLHPMTAGRLTQLVLVARHSSGNGYLVRRSPDRHNWNGVMWVDTAGNWGSPVVIPNFQAAFESAPTLDHQLHRQWERGVQVWKDERRSAGGYTYRCTRAGVTASTGAGPTGTGTAINDGTAQWTYYYNGKAHTPDSETAWVVVTRAAADARGSHITLYTADLALSQIQVENDPGPDWNNAHTFDRYIADRWQDFYAGACLRPMHGGAVMLRLTGADGAKALEAQRVSDLYRVGNVSSVTGLALSGAATIHAPQELVLENVPAPVIIETAGGFTMVKVTATMEPSRYDTPTHDQWWWHSNTSDLSVSDWQSDGPHMRYEGLRQMPGHNVFAATLFSDPGSTEGGQGIMNTSGAFVAKIKNAKSKSLKLNLYAPIGKGQWVDGVFNPAHPFYAGTPELWGGGEWPVCKLDTFFYSEDNGVTWKRVWETDYVLDGESGGGVIVVNLPTIHSNEVVIAHDPYYGKGQLIADLVTWRTNPLVSRVNAQGEILDVQTGQPFSQVATARNGRKVTTVVSNPADATGDAGENFRGVYLTDASGLANKKLMVIWGSEDAQEQSSAQVVRGFIKELLSGSAMASRLLRAYAFLVMPSAAQFAIDNGWSRYGPANEIDPETDDIWYSSPTESGFGACTKDVVLFIREFATRWLAERKAARGGVDDNKGFFAHVTWHADTHSSGERTVIGWPYTAPYLNIAWDQIAQWRSRYDTIVWPEFHSPSFPANYNPDGWSSLVGTYDNIVSGNGGTMFYLEMPWRALPHKGGYWWGVDALDNQAASFLKGLDAITSNDFFGDGAPISATGVIGSPTGVGAKQGTGTAVTSSAFTGIVIGAKSAQTASAAAGSAVVSTALTCTRTLVAAVAAEAAVFAGLPADIKRELTATAAASASVSSTLVRIGRYTSAVGGQAGASATIVRIPGFRVNVSTAAVAAVALNTARQLNSTVTADARVTARLYNSQAQSKPHGNITVMLDTSGSIVLYLETI